MPQRLFTGDHIAAALRSFRAFTPRRSPRLSIESLEARHVLAATVVVNDSFSDGGRTQGADALDIPWFSNEVSAQTASVVGVNSDYVLPGNSLAADNPTVADGTNVTRSIVGLFQTSGAASTTVPQTLTNVGDRIELKLEFHFTNSLNYFSQNRFSFGLYHTGGAGSISGTDGTNATRNDKGYMGTVGNGPVANSAAINRETGTNGLLAQGTDFTVLGAAALGTVNNNLKNVGIFTITKSSPTQATIRMQILDANGATLVDLARVDNSPTTFTFDEIVVAMTGNEIDYNVDNLQVRVITNGGVLPVPAAPTNLLATASGNRVHLAWTDNAVDETGFIIERKIGTGGSYTTLATVQANATAYDDVGLVAGTQYYYRVRAAGSFGDSANAPEKSATTAAALPAGLLLADSLSDGDRTQGADVLDIPWIANETSMGNFTALSVSQDTALSGNTLVADNPTVSAGTLTTRAIVGLFQTSGAGLTTVPQTLTNVGDQIKLNFDFRFTNVLRSKIDTRYTTDNNPPPENRFRFGLYNTGGPGSISGGDPTNLTRNDQGYLGSFGWGPPQAESGVLQEAGNNSSIIAEGTDLTYVGDTTTSYLTVNDNLKHHGVLTITRTGASEVTIRVQVLDATGQTEIDFTRVDSTPATLTFDEIVVAATANDLDYRLDNVEVTTSHVDPAINLGGNRELFVDSYLIGQMSGGAALALHEPQLANQVINFMDKPWEGNWSGGVNVIKDGPLYRMYYFAHPTRSGVDDASIAYAESTDGINWTKPNLGLFTVNGTKNNNVVQVAGAEPWLALYNSYFIDTNPAAPSSQKYKGFTGDYAHGMYVLVSPDGLHWSKFSDTPVLPPRPFKFFMVPGAYDSQNVMFWSEVEKQYVAYMRIGIPYNKPPDSYSTKSFMRWVMRSTSTDLVHWTEPVLMDGGQPEEQWYFNQTSPYFRAPQIYAAFPASYYPDAAGSGHSSRSESRFVVSRPEISGGYQYERPFGTTRWITTGLPPVNFPEQMNWQPYAGRLGLNAVPTGPKEMSIYLEQPGRVVRYALRTDGFASVNAPAGGGTMVTKPFKFAGNQLQINYVAKSGGSVKVEIQDANGNPIPGFALADSVALTGDDIDAPISWKNGFNLASLAGQTIKLRFVMQNANLYSMHFAQTVVAAGWRNPRIPEDVDDNGSVQPVDALTLINELNRAGTRTLPAPTTPPNAPPPYYDPSGDNQLSPLDALLVINNLNASANAAGTQLAALDADALASDHAEGAPLGWYFSGFDSLLPAADAAHTSAEADLPPAQRMSDENSGLGDSTTPIDKSKIASLTVSTASPESTHTGDIQADAVDIALVSGLDDVLAEFVLRGAL